jgi:hypothetical protein
MDRTQNPVAFWMQVSLCAQQIKQQIMECHRSMTWPVFWSSIWHSQMYHPSPYSSMHNHFLHSDRKVVAHWPGTENLKLVNIQKSGSPAFLAIFLIRLHFAVAPVIS